MVGAGRELGVGGEEDEEALGDDAGQAHDGRPQRVQVLQVLTAPIHSSIFYRPLLGFFKFDDNKG